MKINVNDVQLYYCKCNTKKYITNKILFFSFCIVLGSIIFLSSCSVIKSRDRVLFNNLLFQDERELTNNQTEQLLLAIENEDKDSIRKMFSEYAISKSENFDEDIEKLFEYFRGELISFNKNGTYVPYMESGSEGIMKLVDYQNVVRTSEDTYLLTTRYYIVDTVTHDNVGIYSLNILNLEEYRKYDKPEKQENIEYLPGINMIYIKQWADYHWLGIAEY